MLKWILVASMPGLLCAQMPMFEVCRQARPARDLNLSETQQKQISGICKDSFKKISDLREGWKKAEVELEAAFDESPVDQHKSNDAIEHLAAARLEAVSRDIANGSENPHGADRRTMAGVKEEGTPRRSRPTGRTRRLEARRAIQRRRPRQSGQPNP